MKYTFKNDVLRNFHANKDGIQFPEGYDAARILQSEPIKDEELSAYREAVREILDDDLAQEAGLVRIRFNAAVFRPNMGEWRSATFGAYAFPISAKRGVIVDCWCINPGSTAKRQQFYKDGKAWS